MYIRYSPESKGDASWGNRSFQICSQVFTPCLGVGSARTRSISSVIPSSAAISEAAPLGSHIWSTGTIRCSDKSDEFWKPALHRGQECGGPHVLWYVLIWCLSES